MLRIIENYQNDQITTWHIPYTVRYYCELKNLEEVNELRHCAIYKDKSIQKQLIGKGANTLFKEAVFNGLLIAMRIRGRKKITEDSKYEYWKVGAGEDWCELVRFFVLEKSLAGIENLALIPGLAGAAPIQNIAAYGQTFESVCSEVHAIDMSSGKQLRFTHQECQFSYRNSWFKQQIVAGNNALLITSIVLKLKKHTSDLMTRYESNYESLSGILEKMGKPPYSLESIYKAVVQIRNKKLPSIEKVGTNGSVFMNPIVSGKKLQELLTTFPGLQFYPTIGMQHARIPKESILPTEKYKIAAGHMLEKIGWRKRTTSGSWQPKIINQVGVWAHHSLVLVNYGTQHPKHIHDYLKKMQQSFMERTGINITPEINLI